MNKWFESKNIANYAKTALLQAQKKIDQVLDIKEDEILASTSSAVATNLTIPTIQSVQDEQQELNLTTTSASRLKKSSSNSSIASSTTSNSAKLPSSQGTQDTDSFFNNFLSKLDPATSPSPSAVKLEQEIENINFDSFLNQTTIPQAPSPSLVVTTSSNKKQQRSSNINKIKSNNLNIIVSNPNANEAADKQNWIQNYVNSSPTGSSHHHENINDSSLLTNSSLIISSSSSSSTSTANAPVVLLSTSATSSTSNSTNTTTTNAAGLAATNTSNEVIIKDEKEEDIENISNSVHQECASVTTMTSEPIILNESIEETNDKGMSLVEKLEESITNVKSFTESLEFITIDSNNSKEDSSVSNSEILKEEIRNETTILNIEPVPNCDLNSKNNNGSGSLSGNASSNEEGLDTCVSSDIEVLSLPSTTNGDHSKITKSISSTYTKINKAQVQAAQEEEQEEERIQEENNLIHDTKPTIQAHANNMHSQLIANSNVMQIFHNTSDSLSSSPSTPITSNDTLTSNDVKKMKYLLEAREAHILKLNKQNVKLQEDNDNLLSDLEKLKLEQVEKLKSLQFAADLKRELAELRAVTTDKDQQIEELRQEGLKLSKQELNQSNIIKKLRVKEKESEEVTNSLRNDLKKVQKDLNDLKEVCAQKDAELEQMKKLEKAYIQLDKDVQRKQMSLDEFEEKCKSLENNLQNAYKELAELHKSNAVKDVKINEKVNTQEIKIKQEIELAIEKEKSVSVKKQEALKWELESMRSDLARVEQQHSLREDMLRKEIGDLQQQLRESETRNNDLTQNISNATRPLLRQIENLQVSHANQIDLLENSERNLIERLKECQTNLCDLSEKNRQNQESLIDLNQQVKTYEAQIQSLRVEKSNLNAQYQQVKQNLDIHENEKLEKEAQHKLLIGNLQQQIEILTREKKHLQSQLEIEKLKTENDAKKFQALLNEYTKERELQQKILQNKVQQLEETNSDEKRLNKFSISLANGSPDKLNDSDTNSNNHRVFDFGKNTNGNNGTVSYSNVGNALNVLEGLQSKLKLKEGEIVQLQKEINNLERIRESMAKELVNLSNKLDNMQDRLKEYPELQDKFNKLNVEYNALLQMYGEKTEENEELKMDLQDVKDMYKLQIEDLVKRSNL